MKNVRLHAGVCNGHLNKSPQVIYMHIKVRLPRVGAEFTHVVVSHLHGS